MRSADEKRERTDVRDRLEGAVQQHHSIRSLSEGQDQGLRSERNGSVLSYVTGSSRPRNARIEAVEASAWFRSRRSADEKQERTQVRDRFEEVLQRRDGPRSGFHSPTHQRLFRRLGLGAQCPKGGSVLTYVIDLRELCNTTSVSEASQKAKIKACGRGETGAYART